MANLTDDEKKRIRTTLSMFAENVPDNMCKFYQNLLTDNPNFHPMFYRLKTTAVEDFPKNEWLRTTQGPKVAGSVVDLVEKMENLPALQESVHKMVVMPVHTKHNLTADDYLKVLQSLVKTLQMNLGDRMTAEDAAAWVKLAGQLVPLIDAEIKKLPKQK